MYLLNIVTKHPPYMITRMKTNALHRSPKLAVLDIITECSAEDSHFFNPSEHLRLFSLKKGPVTHSFPRGTETISKAESGLTV